MKRHMIGGLLAAVLALGACEEGPAGPEGTGSTGNFEATISGGFNANLSGTALSGTQQGAYLIRLDDTDVQGLPGVIGLFRVAGRPPVGTFSVSTDQTATAAFIGIAITGQTAGQNGLAFQADSGSVTITQSSTSRVQGSFNLVGTGYRGVTPDSTFAVTITGQFDAADQDP